MKIAITIPSSARAEVEEYCREQLGKSIVELLQQRTDDIVCNAVWHMRQRRQIEEDLADADADWNLFKEAVNAK